MLYWIFYYLINTFLTHLMKKFFMTLAAVASMVFSANIAFAQDGAPQSLAELTAAQPEVPLFQAIKSYFIQGGATFMALIIICLIIGLALSIERILTLSFAKKNPTVLVNKVKDALKKGGKDEAIKAAAQEFLVREKLSDVSLLTEADEKKLAKLVSELFELNSKYTILYAVKLHEVENRYLDSHPEDEVED